jgi:hypothetical protein
MNQKSKASKGTKPPVEADRKAIHKNLESFIADQSHQLVNLSLQERSFLALNALKNEQADKDSIAFQKILAEVLARYQVSLTDLESHREAWRNKKV